MRLEVAEVLRDKERMLAGYSRFTGRSVDLLREDFKRDFYLNAYEASQVSRTLRSGQADERVRKVRRASV